MTKVIRAIVAIGVVCAGSVSAMAGETRRMKSEDGIIVTHRLSSDNYCIRTSSQKQAERLALKLHATECQSRANWARDGVTLARRASAASQVASVD